MFSGIYLQSFITVTQWFKAESAAAAAAVKIFISSVRLYLQSNATSNSSSYHKLLCNPLLLTSKFC